MNFDSKLTDVLASLNWATAEEEYEPGEMRPVVWLSCVSNSILEFFPHPKFPVTKSNQTVISIV